MPEIRWMQVLSMTRMLLLASAYFIDRAHSYLAIIANGGSIRFSYGKRKVVTHRIVGDAWYQLVLLVPLRYVSTAHRRTHRP